MSKQDNIVLIKILAKPGAKYNAITGMTSDSSSKHYNTQHGTKHGQVLIKVTDTHQDTDPLAL